MKILAIRGQNLASLYGPFEVDLEAPPIAGAGLFAICGPTGAGKSTLLDALCLALFGRTPRLDDRGGARIGREGDDEAQRLAANDARALLSRGAAQGHAEVVFRGVDGRRWRARWQVRRARGHPGGRLQEQQMTLRPDGGGEPVGEGLAGTRAAIERVLGFGFEEFRRAVVLPQFEFTAFLRATEGERAAILQRVTGTAFYESLSRAAHERAAAEKRALDALEQEAGLLAPLEAERRAALDREAAAARHGHGAAAGALRAAERAVRWHAEAAALADSLGEAEAEVSAARGALDDAAPLRAELAEVERSLPHRAELAAAERAEADVPAREVDAASRASELVQAELAERAAVAALDEAARAHAAARAAEEALRPELDRARSLDAELAAAVEGASEAAREARSAGEAAAAARGELERLAGALAGATAERTRAEEWLAAHAATAPLAAGWERFQRELEQHEGLSRDLARAEARVGAARRALDAASSARAAATAADGVATRARAEAEAGAAAAEEAAARVRMPGIAAERDEVAARVEALAALDRASADAAAAVLAEAALRRAGEGARTRAAALAEAARAAEAERAGADRALREARHAHARAVEALGLEEHRARLVEGDPCPLCGALEHPYRASGGVPATLADELAARVAALDAEVATHAAAGAAADRARAVAEHEASAADERATEAAAALAAAEARWAAALPAAGAPLPQRAVDGAGATSAPLVVARERLAALRRAEEEGRRLTALSEAARRGAHELRNAAEASAEALRCAERGEGEARREHDLAASERDGLAVRRERLEEGVAEAFSGRGGWRDRLRGDPGAFRRDCAREVAEHGAHQVAREERAARVAALASDLREAQARADERTTAADRARAALRAREAQAGALRERRGALLGGRPVIAAEAAARDGLRACAHREEACRDAASGARQARAAAADAADRAALAVEAARKDAVLAAAALAAILARLGCDRDRLAARLSRGESWIGERRADLGRRQTRLDTALGALEARRRAAVAHAGDDPPALGAGEVAAARGAAEDAERAAADALARLEHQVRTDDERRARVAELAPRRAQQERRHRTWAALSDVIGSADGKKLKVFAQSLTLDALLAAANRHLVDLAPRYRVMRVPGTDLDLQVADDDLGAEVRSVNSLSGGESFLVSLALALGLSSLSTRAVRVETLFVDEGFGTLDRDTLDHAVVALEGLHARGRTVGIISHVPELQERLGVQVHVEPVGTGRSRVVTMGRAPRA